jgi:hypothetical protein
MSKPLSNAWEGGDILRETKEVTKSEVQPVSEKYVLIAIKVRPCRSAGDEASRV